MYPPSIQKLIEKFSRFPTVGPRTASRFVFYLLRASKEEIEDLIKLISELKQNIKTCSFCFNPFQPSTGSGREGELCEICSNPARDKSLLCIVANETDLVAIEKTKKYQGLYFILGGTVSTLKKEAIGKLRVEELKNRIETHPEIQEIILALNSTPDGEATTLYLERFLKPLNKKITRLGRGLPVGAELEYADEETLSSALEGRR
jgi:recombination protein RecR